VSSLSSSQQASDPLEELLGGRYRLLEPLSGGGFGQTFLAQDLHLPGNCRCVVKCLHLFSNAAHLKTAQRLFNTEAEVLYQLGDHDQIPRLLAHFEHEQKFYLVQELVVGKSLSELLPAGQPWMESQVVEFLRDILTTLTFVHQQNVIHRDIKPANLICRTRDSKTVLIDFGAVKQVSDQYTYSNPDASHTISIGTQGYMPNEQLAGTPRFSSDIYAVGMIAIQALTGVSPRALKLDPRTSEIEWQNLATQASPGLIAVLNKMTRYDFRARYTTAVEALVAIEQLANISRSRSFKPSFQPLIQSLTPGATAGWQTVAQTSSLLLKPLVQVSTKSVSAFRKASPSPSTAPTIRLAMLTELGQLKFRRLPLPLVGVAALGILAVMVKVSPFSQPTVQLPPASSPSPSVPSSPSASPSPVSPSPVSPSPVSPSPVSPSPKISPSPASSSSPVAQITVLQSEADSVIQVAQATVAAVLLSQADQLRQQGQSQPALDHYQQVIALNPKLAEAQWGSCYSLNALEKFAEAMTACDAALVIKPDYAEAIWSKGYSLDRQQQDQEALKLYEQAIAIKPDFAEAWNNKGAALLQLNQPTEAVAAFDQAVRLKPDFAEAWNNRGAALWKLRRLEEAVKSVNKALEIRPDYQDALRFKQEMIQQLGDDIRQKLR
jgi:eukaryotic-like serine/threonine-protein kinase